MPNGIDIKGIRLEIRSLANPEKAKFLARFFKTGKGEYGEDDQFLGLNVPQSRSIARKYSDMSLHEVGELLQSPFHEERLVALLILVRHYHKGNGQQKRKIFDFYLGNTRFINSWDLVDMTADKIIGAHLNEDRSILYKLSKSSDVWERRMSIIATFHFIRKNDFKDTIRIAEALLDDRHDMIHKAGGWMLREVGKRDLEEEEAFLREHYRKMPRTMLRYAIEKFSEEKRKFYMGKVIQS